ncbi:MAG: sigma-70 family RNA polymerase sigma factor [Spirochaetia bacterium]|nr:sigma-70 family RNA polymerase sigma factor [Spirochaetia bacterium]
MELKTELETEKNTSEQEDDSKIIHLVNRCSEGDSEALKEFFSIYSTDMYNFPIKVFHLDEDAASDFFLYAYERLSNGKRFKSFQGRSAFRTWFYTVLRNLLIDWLRTVREIKTVNVTKIDDNGNEYKLIENTPDPRSILSGDDKQEFKQFISRLNQLSMEMRVIFKLSFIYYLDLSQEEIVYLAEKSMRPHTEVISFLTHLKNKLSEKEMKNIDYEDKITSLFLSIMELKSKKTKLLDGKKKSTENVLLVSADDIEIEKLDRAIEKKYQQREKLLEKMKKGHFISRTPYKYVAEILNIPEGSISVHMMRVTEKLLKS